MTVEICEAVWIDELQHLSLEELVQLSGMPENEIRELIDCAAIVPALEETMLMFDAKCLMTVRAARRLRGDFNLDTDGLVLALALIERIRELEAQLRTVESRVPVAYSR